MKYEVVITNIGEFVLQFMQTRDSMILFDKDVPYEYMNMVVAHSKGEIDGEIAAGDKLHIAGMEYAVTAVGDEAMRTLKEKGHCTLVFKGMDKVEQPGHIMLKGNGLPRVMIGDTIRFE
ncbi:PTS glucitol/sorbitol transporter subunit IIA [Pectinatus haikarae]|uniref:PTS glucitol/sorbitol transporter subunit IIA n=1 Tax=Pectinatus haikarae TaxID=349096 RepID=UPI0018C4B9B8